MSRRFPLLAYAILLLPVLLFAACGFKNWPPCGPDNKETDQCWPPYDFDAGAKDGWLAKDLGEIQIVEDAMIKQDGPPPLVPPKKVACAALLPELVKCWNDHPNNPKAAFTCATLVWPKYSDANYYNYYRNEGNLLRHIAICTYGNCEPKANPLDGCDKRQCQNSTGDPNIDCCPALERCIAEVNLAVPPLPNQAQAPMQSPPQ